MSSNSSVGPIFLDITILIEYCSAYFDRQHYAAKVIDRCHDDGVNLFVSGSTNVALHNRMNNRERLWDHLINEASRILNEYEDPKQEYKAEILNYTSLQASMGFDISKGYISDIEELKENLENKSLEDFREEIDDARIMGKQQRLEIETVKEFNKYSSAQTPWMLQGTISQYTDSEDYTNSVIDYAYWNQTNSGPLIVGSKSSISNHKDEVIRGIKSNLEQTTPDIYS